jgi:hypothetical protein
MNFKRPYWLLLFISLGCLVLGFAGWMFATPDYKGVPDLQWLIVDVAILLMVFGAAAFVVSLIWMTVASILSSIHPHHPKH